MKVQIIEQQGDSALVQWDHNGAPMRGHVPTESVIEGEVGGAILDKAIPYGLSFELALEDISAQDVIARLHQAGIWTFADLQQRDRVLIRIGTDLIGAAVWNAAKRLEG